LPKCFHCGEIGSDIITCHTCLNCYCKFHIDPVIHECSLTIESHKLQHEYNVILNPDIAEQNNPNYTVRGSTNGYYAWAPPEVCAQAKKPPSTSKFIKHLKDYEGTLFLLSLIVLFSFLSLDFWNRQFISLSSYGVFLRYYWTFFTSLFVVTLNSAEEILFFLIGLLFMFKIINDLEKKTNTKLVYFVFGFCGLFSGVIFLVIRFLFAFYMPIGFIDLLFFSVGLGGAGFLGLTAFSVFLEPNLEWNLHTYGIPIRMKGKNLLLVIVALRLIPLFFYGFFNIISILMYCFEFFGILAAYIHFKCWYKITKKY